MPAWPKWHHQTLWTSPAHLQALDQSVRQLYGLVGGRHLLLTTDFLPGRLFKLSGQTLQAAVKVLKIQTKENIRKNDQNVLISRYFNILAET